MTIPAGPVGHSGPCLGLPVSWLVSVSSLGLAQSVSLHCVLFMVAQRLPPAFSPCGSGLSQHLPTAAAAFWLLTQHAAAGLPKAQTNPSHSLGSSLLLGLMFTREELPALKWSYLK